MRGLIDRRSALELWTLVKPAQKKQKNKRKTQSEENDLQQRLGAKRRLLRVIELVVQHHQGNHSDYLSYRTVDDNFIEIV